jgi:hypothetical protein
MRCLERGESRERGVITYHNTITKYLTVHGGWHWKPLFEEAANSRAADPQKAGGGSRLHATKFESRALGNWATPN